MAYIKAQAEGDHAKPLVVVGSINADLVLEVERLPKDGETLGASSLNTFPGGKGANQAAAAARLEHPTYMIGQVGTDANAALLRDALSDAGVRLDHLREVHGPTGTAVILLQPSGENSIIIVGGANTAAWDFDDAALELLRSAGAVLLQREIPEEVNVHVAGIAASAGVPVLLDCGGVEGPISSELLKNISILSPNETELARLTGRNTESQEEAEAAAQVMLGQGVDIVLVKRGTSGSLQVSKDAGPLTQAIFPVEKVVDTTGAGDCFTGAYAVAIVEGKGASEAMKFAAAASALCVQKAGAMPSLPHRDEVVQLIENHNA
ncbi:Ribokinase [Coccomyxa sp. Obi]|nr:Ribokinase [Coccomyxa sp. Obi]